MEKGIFFRKMERQLAGYVAKNPKTTLKTLTNDLTKSGIEVSRKTVHDHILLTLSLRLFDELYLNS